MNKYVLIGVAAAAVVVVAVIVFLGARDVPAPAGTVETRLDDSRFPR